MSLFQTLVPSFNGASRSAQPGRESQPTLKPAYEIKENDEAFGLTVYLPGVAKEGLEIVSEDGVLTITGRREWKAPAGWATLYRETSSTPFELSLRHDNVIDVDRIHAELKDGVLRASLPKAEVTKPKKIAVS